VYYSISQDQTVSQRSLLLLSPTVSTECPISHAR